MTDGLPVAVDAMGGDHAPTAVVQGAAMAVREGLPVVLVGRREQIEPHLPRGVDVPIVQADDVFGMDASPASIRRRPETSIVRGLELVRDGEACAMLSCGNTGAVLVASVVALGTQEGVERPAIATLLPRVDGERVVLLDAGANVDCRPEQLACFALLGAAYAEALGVSEPRVGLLSNGEEDGKGNMQVRATLPLLRKLPLEVVGNVEPTGALEGRCDVLVCDGFVGNVLLKSIESASSLVVQLLTEEIRRRPSARMGAFLVSGAFKRFKTRVAWDAHGGALLLGVNGLVVVGHGRANPEAVAAAIRLAHDASDRGLVDAVSRRVAASIG